MTSVIALGWRARNCCHRAEKASSAGRAAGVSQAAESNTCENQARFCTDKHPAFIRTPRFGSEFRRCQSKAVASGHRPVALPLQIQCAEEIAQLDFGGLGRVGTVDAVALDGLGEEFADGAWGGFG